MTLDDATTCLNVRRVDTEHLLRRFTVAAYDLIEIGTCEERREPPCEKSVTSPNVRAEVSK
jgi:hypothetical protein